MELILTGRTFDAEEAEKWGVASRVVRTEKADVDEHLPVVKEALDLASKIAGFGQLATQAGKEAVNACTCLTATLSPFRLLTCAPALDLPLSEGLRLERRLFHSLFATNDQKEGEDMPVSLPHSSLIVCFRHGCLCRETQGQLYAHLTTTCGDSRSE
jgi:enoyl-CoA hydratase